MNSFLYFCGLIFSRMEEENRSEGKSKDPKRGTVFLIAIVIGLLFGVLATLLVVDIVGKRQPIEVTVVPPDSTATKSSKDTIVKYVIHKHEYEEMEKRYMAGDTLPADSSYLYDESEDLTLDDIEIDDEASNTEVTEAKLMNKYSVKVVYLDDDKTPAAEQPSDDLHVQIWETPIKNKFVYQFQDDTLKLKGVILDQIKVYHYRNNFYLVTKNHVYLLHQNNQYERLVETHEVVF